MCMKGSAPDKIFLKKFRFVPHKSKCPHFGTYLVDREVFLLFNFEFFLFPFIAIFDTNQVFFIIFGTYLHYEQDIPFCNNILNLLKIQGFIWKLHLFIFKLS